MLEVVSACTSRKDPAITKLAHRTGSAPCCLYYAGHGHRKLSAGVRRAREAGAVVSWRIISARYGLLGEGARVKPYNQTFTGMGQAQLRAHADKLQLPHALAGIWGDPTQLRILALSAPYLEAVKADELPTPDYPTIAFVGGAWADRLPPGVRAVVLGPAQARICSVGLVALKGALAGALLAAVATDPSLVPLVLDPGTDVVRLLGPQL